MRHSSHRLSLLMLLVPPVIFAQGPASGPEIEQSRLTISTLGGLPQFFSDDIRLQWIVPGDADAEFCTRRAPRSRG